MKVHAESYKNLHAALKSPGKESQVPSDGSPNAMTPIRPVFIEMQITKEMQRQMRPLPGSFLNKHI